MVGSTHSARPLSLSNLQLNPQQMSGHAKPTSLLVILLLVVIALACAEADSSTSNHTPSTSQTKSHLRVSPTPARNEDTSEDRMFNGAKFTEVVKQGMQKINTVTKDLVIAAKLELMPMNQRSVSKLFSHFKVEEAGLNVFESVQFKQWETSVTKLYKTNSEAANMAMVSTMTVEYRDQALARMLVAAKEVSDTKDVASNLLKAQMKYWISQKKSADQVFRYLELDQAGENVLASPLLKRYLKFVQQKSEDPYRALFLDLSTRFDEKGLANVLLGSKVGFGKKFDYHKLDDLVVQKWVDSEKTVDDVYELLKLRNVESSDFLQNPALNTWVSFVTKRLDNSNTSPHELLYRKLITQYDDKGLANVLLGPKGDFGEKFDFLKFDDLILQKWVDSGKTVDEAYDLLKLRNVESSDFLQSPALANWLSFMTKLDSRFYNAKTGPYELLYRKLISQYDDRGLANVLLGPKGDFGKKFDYHKLDELVLQKWVESGKTADDVYDLMKLRNVESSDFLQNPALENWLSFATKLASRLDNPNTGPSKLLYGKLKSQYDDNELANMLLGPKGGFGGKFELHKLDDLVLQEWVNSGKTVNEVYELLKLGNGKNAELLQNPALETWLAFMTKLNSPLHNPYEELYNRLLVYHGSKDLMKLVGATKNGGNTRAKILAETLETEFLRIRKERRDKVLRIWRGDDP